MMALCNREGARKMLNDILSGSCGPLEFEPDDADDRISEDEWYAIATGRTTAPPPPSNDPADVLDRLSLVHGDD